MKWSHKWAGGVVNATTTTVIGYGRLEINAPARRGQRVYVAAVSHTSDVDNVNTLASLQDATELNIVSTTANTSTTVTSAALFGSVEVAMKVTGTGIPANTYVGAVTDTSTITITNAATADGTVTLTFTGSTKFALKVEPQSATFAQPEFVPCFPIPISAAGSAARFFLNTTTTGRLSVAYCYGP